MRKGAPSCIRVVDIISLTLNNSTGLSSVVWNGTVEENEVVELVYHQTLGFNAKTPFLLRLDWNSPLFKNPYALHILSSSSSTKAHSSFSFSSSFFYDSSNRNESIAESDKQDWFEFLFKVWSMAFTSPNSYKLAARTLIKTLILYPHLLAFFQCFI